MEIARHTSPDACAGLADAELLAWDAPDLQLCHPIELDPQRGIELAIECERLALGRDTRIKHSDGAGFSSHLGIKVYGNSHGFVKGYAASRNSLSCVLIGEQDGDMQRDYGYSSSRTLDGLWSPQRIADEAVERTPLSSGGPQDQHSPCSRAVPSRYGGRSVGSSGDGHQRWQSLPQVELSARQIGQADPARVAHHSGVSPPAGGSPAPRSMAKAC